MNRTKDVLLVCGEATEARMDGAILRQLTQPLEVVFARTKDELLRLTEEYKPKLCLIEHEVPVVSATDHLKQVFPGDLDMAFLAGNQSWSFGSETIARELLPDLSALSPGTRFVITCHIRHGGMGNAERQLYKQIESVEKVVGFINAVSHSTALIKLISTIYFGESWTPQLLADLLNKSGSQSIPSDDPPEDVFSRNNNDIPVFHVRDNKVYFMKSAIRGANPESFERIVGPWAKDKKKIYYCSDPCPKIDVDSCEVLNIIYGKAFSFCGQTPDRTRVLRIS